MEKEGEKRWRRRSSGSGGVSMKKLSTMEEDVPQTEESRRQRTQQVFAYQE
jgi:hypothetical protein